MAGYQGWPSWEAWNVALWIGNDERIYRMAKATVDRVMGNGGKIEDAAKSLMQALPKKTPDGATYTVETVVGAIEHFSDLG